MCRRRPHNRTQATGQARDALRRALAAHWEDGTERAHAQATAMLEALDRGEPIR